MSAFEAATSFDIPAMADAHRPRSGYPTSDGAKRFLWAVGVVISLVGSGCTTNQPTRDGGTGLKSGCAENQYLTGPRFPTCNNI
jgi:hypothetical protein